MSLWLRALVALLFDRLSRPLPSVPFGESYFKLEETLQSYILVFAGGGIGAALRYWLSGVVQERFGSAFPYGTLAVNVLGCFVIGIVMASMRWMNFSKGQVAVVW